MSEYLPYEDELSKRLHDLSLPDEDIAWEDMRRRLDKDDTDKPVVPPVSKGCGGYVLLLIIFVIASLLVIDPAKWFHGKKNTVDTLVKVDALNKVNTAGKVSAANKVATVDTVNREDTVNKIKMTIKPVSKASPAKKNVVLQGPFGSSVVPLKVLPKRKPSFSSLGIPRSQQYLLKKKPILTNVVDTQKKENNRQQNIYSQKHIIKNTEGHMKSAISGGESDSLADNSLDIRKRDTLNPVTPENSDTAANVNKPLHLSTVEKKKPATTTLSPRDKTDSAKQRHLRFGAGLAMHQLLPIAGQKSNPYNSLGRKSSLNDYIPSAYLRMYKDKKWFIQSEFRYGAPQYTKNIVFQKKIIDTFTVTVTSSSSSLKKTFYHQLPVSFNYFVLPGLSIGLGITFNKFNSAIVQQEVHKTNPTTMVDSLLSTALVNQKKSDSNFATIYAQALIETQYHWRRFSGGARYSFGLQPYLKFKLPGGQERREKNSALQLFIRYELWRSAKK